MSFPSVENLLPGSASLVDCLDKRIYTVLRDGRSLFGILRSYDQFANLVFQDTVERIYSSSKFCEINHGLFMIRGENVVLLGIVDGDLEDNIDLCKAPLETVLLEQRDQGILLSHDFDKF